MPEDAWAAPVPPLTVGDGAASVMVDDSRTELLVVWLAAVEAERLVEVVRALVNAADAVVKLLLSVVLIIAIRPANAS
jgi:hypothetical protein